jgi:hypothetical protein
MIKKQIYFRKDTNFILYYIAIRVIRFNYYLF